MIALQHILVATDFSEPSAVALAYGRDLARAYGATLHVVHVVADVTTPYAIEAGFSNVSFLDEMLAAATRDLAALLHQHAPVGACVAQLFEDRLLGALVGLADEVGGTLAADLQLLDLVEIAAQARRGLAGGALDDGHDAGMAGHFNPFSPPLQGRGWGGAVPQTEAVGKARVVGRAMPAGRAGGSCG